MNAYLKDSFIIHCIKLKKLKFMLKANVQKLKIFLLMCIISNGIQIRRIKKKWTIYPKTFYKQTGFDPCDPASSF